jgi:hypothetical protein
MLGCLKANKDQEADVWILRRKGNPERLYLMKSGTRDYVDHINLDASSIEDLRWLHLKLQGWFGLATAPGSLLSYDPAVEPDPEPIDGNQPPKPDTKPPGTNEPAEKPAVKWVRSPNFSARGSGKINKIVLHYTTSRNINGSISWFQNPASRVSAHYIVGREGEIVQMVRDSDKAWHAAGHNDTTIGIEHVAANGDKLSPAQEKATIQLCRWLMAEYRIPKQSVTGHRWLPNSTSCPGSLWPTEADLRAWVNRHL